MHGKVDLGCSRMYDSGAQIAAQKTTKKRMAQACPMPNLGPSVLEVWYGMVVAQTFQLPMDQLCVWGPFFQRSIVIKEFSGDSSHVCRMVLGSRPRERAQGQVVPAPSIACQFVSHCSIAITIYHSNLTHSWRWLSQLFEASFMI